MTKEKPTVRLISEDGNAFTIIGACSRALRKAGMGEEVKMFLEEATSGDYDDLLRTAMKYCEVE